MPRRIACWLLFAAAGAGLVWAGWPGGPADPATLINRVSVIAIVAILAVLPWVIQRRFGPPARTWRARAVRAGGYAAVLALMLAETHAARFEYAGAAKRHLLAGVWAGEAVFVVVLAAYAAGLLAVTAQRPPAAPGALAIGARTGVAVGLIMYVLPPMGHPLHEANAWLAWLYDAARVLALMAAFGITIAAAIAAARRTPARRGRLPVTDARARHGVAAGLCAGAIAALIVCGLGLATAALRPHEAARIAWTLPDQVIAPGAAVDQHLALGLNVGRHPSPGHAAGRRLPPGLAAGRHLSPGLAPGRHLSPGAVYEFEMGVSDSGAGYLVVLIVFPLFGAGLGAWGGLYGAGQPRRRPGGGGGGGGPDGPAPLPPPPDEDARRDSDLPALLRGGYLRELPVTEDLSPAPEQQPAVPAGTGAPAHSGPRRALGCGDGGEPGPPGG
jgi:hypothetical protein